MIDIDVRRHARALERVRTAISANALNTAQARELEASFERGWKAAAGSVTAQQQHTQTMCDLAAKLGKRGPNPPGRPPRHPAPPCAPMAA